MARIASQPDTKKHSAAASTSATVGSGDTPVYSTVRMPAYRDGEPSGDGQACLYRPAEPSQTKRVTATFIPYFAFANRGKSDMAVWIRRH